MTTSDQNGIDLATRARIAAAADAQRSRLVSLLQDVVRIPSVTGDEGAVQARIADEMRSMGLAVDVWEPDIDAMRPYEEAVGRPDAGSYAGRPVVVGTRRGAGGGRSLILNAHIDTVEPGDPARWRHGPFSGDEADGAVWGRGSLDMKGGLVTNLIALRALSDAGITLRGDVHAESVISEEDGGAGTVAARIRPSMADAAIITEPTDMRIVAACEGSFVFRLTVQGKAGHAASRDEGVSAIELWLYLHQGLLEYEGRRNAAAAHPLFADFANKLPLNIGTIRGGSWPSSVPEWLVVEGRGGVLPGESLVAVREEFVAEVERLAAAHPWLRGHVPVIEWFSGQFTASEIAIDHPLVDIVGRAHRQVTGEPATIAAMTAGTDQRHFLDISGIPCLVYGAGDVRLAHQTDERIEIADLMDAVRVLAITIAAWCGVAEPAATDDTAASTS